MSTFFIIGINDNVGVSFTPDITPIISSHRVFSGGTKQYDMVRPMLPDESVWIEIKDPFDELFETYSHYTQKEEIVVFASGDPLYYGFTTTIMKYLPDAEVKMFPNFTSLHTLAYHLMIPFHDMCMVDFQENSWRELDNALIRGKNKIGIATNRTFSPAAIAERMMEYGFNNYKMYVGEHVSNVETRIVRQMALPSAVSCNFCFPNCVILIKEHDNSSQQYGIPDHFFTRVKGQEMKITPVPIRLYCLSLLDLKNKTNFWDIGFCTGSVAIEAKLQYPHLNVTGFDREKECEQLLIINSRRCGTPGINIVVRDFCDSALALHKAPDAVFIGGHGGRLIEIISHVNDAIEPGGVIVFCSLDEESNVFFLEAARTCNLQVVEQTRFTIDYYESCTVFKAVSI